MDRGVRRGTRSRRAGRRDARQAPRTGRRGGAFLRAVGRPAGLLPGWPDPGRCGAGAGCRPLDRRLLVLTTMRKVLISGGAADEARSWADGLRAAGVESSVVGEDSLVPLLAGDATVVIVAGDAPDPVREARLTEAFRLVMRAAAGTSTA